MEKHQDKSKGTDKNQGSKTGARESDVKKKSGMGEDEGRKDTGGSGKTGAGQGRKTGLDQE